MLEEEQPLSLLWCGAVSTAPPPSSQENMSTNTMFQPSLSPTPLPPIAGLVFTEDPTLWKGRRGFHALFHSSAPNKTLTHAFSEDAFTWHWDPEEIGPAVQPGGDNERAFFALPFFAHVLLVLAWSLYSATSEACHSRVLFFRVFFCLFEFFLVCLVCLFAMGCGVYRCPRWCLMPTCCTMQDPLSSGA